MLRKVANAIVTPVAYGITGAGIGGLVVGGGGFFINLFFVEGRGVCEAARRIAKEKGCTIYKGGAGIDGGRCDDMQIQNCVNGTTYSDILKAAEHDPSVPPSTLLEWTIYGAISGAALGFVIGFGTGVMMVIDGHGILIKQNDSTATVQSDNSKTDLKNPEPNVDSRQNDKRIFSFFNTQTKEAQEIEEGLKEKFISNPG